MKELWENIVKNKYIIIFVCIVVFLYAIGVFEYLFKLCILVVLVALAVFAGKKVQDNEDKIKRYFDKTFKGKDRDVYYYQSRDDDK